MRAKIFLGIILTFSAFSLQAQEIPFKIQKSLEFKDEYKASVIVLSETDEKGNILIIRSYKNSGLSSKKGFYIENYDSNLKLIHDFDFEIDHPVFQKNSIVLGVFKMNNEIQIIEIYFDVKQKSYICQANSISADFKVSKKELFRLSKDDIQNYGSLSLEDLFYERENSVWTNNNSGEFKNDSNSYSNNNTFSILPQKSTYDSELKSRITLVVNQSKTAFAVAIDFEKKSSEFLKAYLFSETLNKTFEVNFSPKVKDKKYIFQNIQVSDNGKDLFLLSKAFYKELKNNEDGRKYIFELIKFNENSQNSQTIDTKQYYINSLKLAFHNNELICLGFYSDFNDYEFKGISYFKLDSNSLALLQSKFNPFTEQFMIDKYDKNKEKSVEFLNFRKLFFTPENDLIFNAEEEYVAFSNPIGFGGGGAFTAYNGNVRTIVHFDDIVSAKLSSSGDLIWARNINKKQSKSSEDNDSYVSYSSILKGNTTYFFINAGEKIKKLKNDRIEFGQVQKNKSNLNIIRINASGDFDYEEILDDENTSVPFMVSKGVQINEDSILFLGRKGTTKQLLKVSIQ